MSNEQKLADLEQARAFRARIAAEMESCSASAIPDLVMAYTNLSTLIGGLEDDLRRETADPLAVRLRDIGTRVEMLAGRVMAGDRHPLVELAALTAEAAEVSQTLRARRMPS